MNKFTKVFRRTPALIVMVITALLFLYTNCSDGFQSNEVSSLTIFDPAPGAVDPEPPVLVPEPEVQPPKNEPEPPKPDPVEESPIDEPVALCETKNVFCDDFEKYNVGENPNGHWSVEIRKDVTISVDSSKTFSGDKSVKIKSNSGQRGDFGMITLGDITDFKVEGNSFYARAMIYIDKVPDQRVHWDIVLASGKVPNAPFNASYAYGGQVDKRYIAVYNTLPYNEYLSDCYQHSNDANTEQDRMVEGKWACFEWRFDGPNNRSQMWVNDLPASNMDIQGRSEGCLGQASGGVWLAPDYSKLQIGWAQYLDSGTSHEMWVDDVIVSTDQIGCPVLL